jgi:hypothetical protein
MKKTSRYYALLGVLIAGYVALFALTPLSAGYERFNISAAAARAISLIVIIPYIAIWFTAFYGFIKVKQYANLIKNTKDGKGLSAIGDGLMVIAVYLPLSSMASLVRSYAVAQDSSLLNVTTIIYNYFALGLVLCGFFFISKGAKQLVSTIKKFTYTLNHKVGALIFVMFSGVFAYATLTNPSRQFPSSSSAFAAYALPDWLITLTIVLPYIVVWFLGYLAAYQIDLYRRNVKGILYQQALALLSKGVAAIVGAIMLLRILTSLTGFFNKLGLQILLLIIYLLLIIISIGFILVALGAKKLKKIEEV